ncbi:hypothetical protein QBC45DRAFT_465823 [Copromyces sp. CBS 386.78]|nr:hypothetical protein QBC45DRAFT_465823 [Copromyces sp. CBS 386.78]
MLPKPRRKNFATGGGRSTTTTTTTAKPRRSTAKKANYVEPQTTTDKDKSAAASIDYDALDDSPTGHLAKKTRTTPESQLQPQHQHQLARDPEGHTSIRTVNFMAY